MSVRVLMFPSSVCAKESGEKRPTYFFNVQGRILENTVDQ